MTHSTTVELNLGVVSNLVMRKLHSGETATVRDALEQIVLLCRAVNPNSEKNRRAFVLAGGYGTVVLIMEKWPKDRQIQIKGLSTICNVTFKNSLIPSDAGLIETVVALLYRFNRDSALVETGMVALNNLCYDCQPNIERTVNGAGLGVVVEAMTLFDHHDKIQMWGTKLLNKASVYETFAQSVITAGGLKVLTHVIQNHTSKMTKKEAWHTYQTLMKTLKLDDSET
jgi:hypothetical protein